MDARRLREQLLQDPDTRRIADSVQLPLEEYVELVLGHAADPKKEPRVKIAPEGTARPSMAEVKQFMEDVISGKESLDPTAASGFDAENPDVKFEPLMQRHTSGNFPQPKFEGEPEKGAQLNADVSRERRGDVGS